MVSPEVERQGWVERPMAARAVGALVYLIPFLASVSVAFVLSSSLDPAPSLWRGVFRWVCIALVSTSVLLLVERQTRRLLPLRALLGMDLAFPDRAPSRFRIAIRTGTTRQLRERLAEAHAGRLGDTPSEAAERLLELVGMLSIHDRLTRGHSERVRAYTHLIAEEMGFNGRALDRLRWAGLLHDVGKLAVSADILNKPGELTAAEFDVVKTHPMEGKRLVAPLADWLGDAVRAVWEHHERWDGGGYPAGLAGTEISIAARIVAVADAYDVMTSARSYKAASNPTEARAELIRCSGSQFDPDCVRAFLAVSISRVKVTMGPLSWLAQLSLLPSSIASQAGPVFAATAAVSAGAAAGSVGIVASPADLVAATEQLPEVAVESIDEEVAVLPPPATTVVTVDVPRDDDEASRTASPDDEGPASSAPAADDASGPDPSETPGRPPPTEDVAPPDAAPPTTAPPPTTPPTTPAPSTTEPPATTEPPPTTELPPTTEPPPTVLQGGFFLASSGVGSVASSAVLPISTSAPTEDVLHNYDTDRDDDPGLTIERSDVGVDSDDERERQAFRIGLTGRIDGDVLVQMWVAAEGFDDQDVDVEVSLRHCTRDGSCTTLSRRSKRMPNADSYKFVTLPMGAIDVTLEDGDELELLVATAPDADEDLWLAYGTTDFDSRIRIND